MKTSTVGFLAFAACLLLTGVFGFGGRGQRKGKQSLGPNTNADDEDDFLYGLFPAGFMWGLATSSYQIEGGWDADGKGENIWDFWAHNDSGANIDDRSNGDVACDSYHRIPQDVEILKNMGVRFLDFQ